MVDQTSRRIGKTEDCVDKRHNTLAINGGVDYSMSNHLRLPQGQVLIAIVPEQQ